ncbi:MAG: hypothetical protein ACR2OZ_04370 [Verrucomicrobiales bacterium]
MNKFQWLIWLAGAAQLAILSASALVPKICDWRAALAPLPPFLRTLFWVYGTFIVLTICGLGLLTMIFAREMAAGQPVARGLAAFVAIFWSARLLVQLFVFDARAYLTTRWLKAGYHALTLAFLYITAVCAWAALPH